MKIEVKLYGMLKKYARDGRTAFSMTLAPSATVRDALAALQVPPGTQRTTLLNGRRVSDDAVLEPGATLVLFPLISGG